MSTDQPERATAQFPTRAEMDQFARSQNERFDLAALMVKMKKDAEAVIEANPSIVTGTATKNFTEYTSGRLPEITVLARCVLAHHEQVGGFIEAAANAAAAEAGADAAAAAAAHAIQLDRAYQAMMSHSTKPVVAYGEDRMFYWNGKWIDAPGKTARKILDYIGERKRVPTRGLFAVTGANRGTLKTQINRANKCIKHLGYELQVRGEFVNVSYSPV